MTVQELNTYINRVLGNSIRCLLPSYWWKRLLTLIVEYVGDVDGKVNKINDKVYKMENVVNKLYGITVLADTSGSVSVYNGQTITIPAGASMHIRFTERFRISSGAKNVKYVDTSLANTAKVQNMSSMFSGCTQLSSLDVSNFDTSKVTDMSYMFNNCSNLQSLNVKNFKTSRVNDMRMMFYNCSHLYSLDVSNFDTSKVTDMSYMFYSCYNLYSINVKNFKTSKVTDMSVMFARNKFSSLDLSNFDTTNVTNMGSMFLACDRLTSLDLSNFRTMKVTDMSDMFDQCSSLVSLDISNFDTGSVTNMTEMLTWCSSLEELMLGEGFFKTPYVTSINLGDLSNWAQDSFIQSVVVNSYDRALYGLSTLEIVLHPNVYAYLTDEHKATLTAKGYTITTAGE